MEAELHNNEGRAPPRRRRRGACEGCKQSKVRCDGNTPCEYCMRYSRTCLYDHNSARRHRRQSSSSSLCLSSTKSAPTTVEQHNETPISQHTPASTIFNFDFSQCPTYELGDESFKDFLPSTEDPWYDLLNHSGPCTLDWDLTTLKATDVADIQKEDPNTGYHSSGSELNIGIHSEIAVASTACKTTDLPRTGDQDYIAHDPDTLDIGVRNRMTHRGVLNAEELGIVDSALKQLCTSMLPNCGITTRTEIPQEEVWKLLLDEEWRKAGIRAAFDVYTGLGEFLWENEIISLAEEALTHSRTDSLSAVLVLGVIAVGRHILESQTTSPLVFDLGGSQQVFVEACTRVKPYLLGHNSLLKLQALIALTIMSIRSDDTIAFDLISYAGTCVQTLRTHKGAPSSNLDYRYEEGQYQVNLNLATGALYCLEHQFSLSNVNLANHTRPFYASSTISEDFRVRWMAGQVEYIKLCSYGNKRDSQDRSRELIAELRNWKANLPAKYHDVDQPYSGNIASDGRKLWIFCQYHEASLRFDVKREGNAVDILENTEHGLGSARVILEVASLLPSSVVLVNRKVNELVSSATRQIFNAVLRDPGPSAQANLRYLGMACGFFARLAVVNPVPFDAMMDLLCVAQKATKRSKPMETAEN